jgi:hypothetical protein
MPLGGSSEKTNARVPLRVPLLWTMTNFQRPLDRARRIASIVALVR